MISKALQDTESKLLSQGNTMNEWRTWKKIPHLLNQGGPQPMTCELDPAPKEMGSDLHFTKGALMPCYILAIRFALDSLTKGQLIPLLLAAMESSRNCVIPAPCRGLPPPPKHWSLCLPK